MLLPAQLAHIDAQPADLLCAPQDDTSEQDAARAEMQKTMENFVKGMLTNHSQLPLQGIHNKLTMFSTAPRAVGAAALLLQLSASPHLLV